jgi:hypothetical protein
MSKNQSAYQSAALLRLSTRLFNAGYALGHHETVEGTFTPIHPSDEDEIHEEEATELVEMFLDEETDLNPDFILSYDN